MTDTALAIAQERAAWRREREAIEAEMRAVLAGWREVIANQRAEAARGRMPLVQPWSRRSYAMGEVVTHDGSTWQARRDTAAPPPAADWACIARAGRGFTIRGTWIEGERYAAHDVVMLNGSSFVARRDDPGACPGPDWQLLAAQGKRGERQLTDRKGTAA